MSAFELFDIEGREIRVAMQKVMPDVPDLAHELADSPLIIRDKLLGHLAIEEETAETEALFDQIECATIMGATGRSLNSRMLVGSGRTARFKTDPRLKPGDNLFYGLMFHIADYVQELGTEEAWTAPASGRFDELIEQRRDSPPRVQQPGRQDFELMKYWQALRMLPLLTNLNGLVRLVNRVTEPDPAVDANTRARYTHDLDYLPLSRASLNAVGLFNVEMEERTLDSLQGTIVNRHGRAVFRPSDEDAWRNIFPRAPVDAPPTLKCPFHQPYEFGESTPLADQLHASITAAHELFGAFDRQNDTNLAQ